MMYVPFNQTNNILEKNPNTDFASKLFCRDENQGDSREEYLLHCHSAKGPFRFRKSHDFQGE